ncbi:uncharacterized protein V1513DRAFT_423080 [Lipomyces chichibuensis]|uniref:uncharacterized protein n=1 Tax=Lipomyces chichibuensis TaxID=1546026 RepID=UPI0033439902
MPAETLIVRHMDPVAAGFHQPASTNSASQHSRKARQDVPPAVAALLAVTAIPLPRTSSKPVRRRKPSVKDESTAQLQKSSQRPSIQRSTSPNSRNRETSATTDTIPVRPKTSRKSSALSSTSSPSSSSRRKLARQKQRTYPSELVELLTPPPVDSDSDSDAEESPLPSPSNGHRMHEVNPTRVTPVSPPLSNSPPQLSLSVSSTDSSPRVSPTTPFSSDTEYFPVTDAEDSGSETSTLNSSSTTSTVQPQSSSSAASRHRKQLSESIAMYNDDPLCVALDENGVCISAMTFVPAEARPTPSTPTSIPDIIRIRNAKRPQVPPRRKSRQELLEEEYARQHSSMVAKINTSLRSLKWIASSMARHQEEYMSKDEIDHLEQPRRSRSVDHHMSNSPVHNSSASLTKRRSSSTTRRQRSESVPGRTHVPGREIRYRSLSAGGVTARSSARALTMQVPLSERQSTTALCYTAPQSSPVGVASGAIDGEEVEQLPCIQMQTYDVQQNCLPIFRPREPRMNGDFLRILAMELQMRRNGKLSHDFYSGKARMVLAPRNDYGHLEKKTRNWTPWTA